MRGTAFALRTMAGSTALPARAPRPSDASSGRLACCAARAAEIDQDVVALDLDRVGRKVLGAAAHRAPCRCGCRTVPGAAGIRSCRPRRSRRPGSPGRACRCRASRRPRRRDGRARSACRRLRRRARHRRESVQRRRLCHAMRSFPARLISIASYCPTAIRRAISRACEQIAFSHIPSYQIRPARTSGGNRHGAGTARHQGQLPAHLRLPRDGRATRRSSSSCSRSSTIRTATRCTNRRRR